MSILLRGGALIDGTGADPVRSTSVQIEGERIAAIGGAAKADEVIDLEGCTLLPGLIDAHTHLGLAYDFRARAGEISTAEIAAAVFRNCSLALDSGFTTCRDLAGLDGGIVAAIAKGSVRGPRIYPSGPALAQDGGHGTFMPRWSDCHCAISVPGLVDAITVCNGPDEVRLAARKAFRRGATQIKVFLSGGVVSLTDELDDTQLAVEEIRVAVEEARARNTYVTAHAHNNRAIRNGLAAGVSCFEHGSWLDEETAEAMAAAGAALVPTLAIAHVMKREYAAWGLPALVVPRIEQVERHMKGAVGVARSAGVTVGSGSDLIGANQRERGLELVLRAAATDPLEAIVAATATNARILGIGDRLGSVAVGRLADLVAVRGDPLREPALFGEPERIALVIKGGVVEKNTLRAD
ncbi:MAG: amidohydrolase family protein [Candidatus Binatia bacterium]